MARVSRLYASRVLVVACSSSLALLGIANGCGSETSTFESPDGGASRGANGSSGAFGGGDLDGGDLPDGASSSDAACARATGQTALKPLDMFVILDRTASMGTDCNIGDTTASLWCRAVNSLSAYFKSPAATGNAAAFHFFSRNDRCDGSGHDISTVPGGTTGYVALPSSAFDGALNTENPTGGFGTRTEGAIRGLAAFTARPANRRAGRATIGVIVTDGNPTECSTESTTLSNLLQAHYAATGGANGGVRTFLVGMTGADDATLEAIAAGGNAPPHPTNVNGLTGTCGSSPSPCRHWNVGSGNGNVLVEALKEIQAATVGCSLRMPKPESGTLDLNQVRIEYSAGGNPPARNLVRVPNERACVADGFYYDDNDAPTTVNLCPAICRSVSSDSAAKVEVIAACVVGGVGGGILR